MATLDIILLICFIPGIIRGISKGFLEQALSLVGIVLSVWAAFKFSALVCDWLKPYLSLSETTLNVVAFALILVAVCAVIMLVCVSLVRAVCARLKVEILFRFYWRVVAVLAAVSLILAWLVG